MIRLLVIWLVVLVAVAPAIATPSSVTVDRPVIKGAPWVSGTAGPGDAVHVIVIQDPTLTVTVTADDSGHWAAKLARPLELGYVIQATANGAVGYAVVESGWQVFLPVVQNTD